MLSFRETVKVALRLPRAKFYAAVTVLAPIASILVAVFVKDRKYMTALLMFIVFPSTMIIRQFGSYISAVRMEDMKRNGKDAGSGSTAKKKRKKK